MPVPEEVPPEYIAPADGILHVFQQTHPEDQTEGCDEEVSLRHRRCKRVHLRTLKNVLKGRGNVQCGGIFRDT